jgi:hypothetical protein
VVLPGNATGAAGGWTQFGVSKSRNTRILVRRLFLEIDAAIVNLISG